MKVRQSVRLLYNYFTLDINIGRVSSRCAQASAASHLGRGLLDWLDGNLAHFKLVILAARRDSVRLVASRR